MVISYKGKQVDSIFYKEVSDELAAKLKEEYFRKPDKKAVKQQLIDINNGKLSTNLLTDYYFKDLMAKVLVNDAPWTIEDLFDCKDLLGRVLDFIDKHPKVFPSSDPPMKNLAAAIRIGSKSFVMKPTQFPITTADEVLKMYNVNNKYYDFSCGWGIRLTAAMKNGIDYYGTDPNYLLCDRLNELAADYKAAVKSHKKLGLLSKESKTNIYCQGSEVFIPELENTIGIAFSSPPYFTLECYNVGEQSCNRDTDYNDWLTKYVEPTIKNIKRYLIDGGYFIFNLNNFKKYKLVEDWARIAEENGFTFVAEHPLMNIKRINEKRKLNDNSERIMVYKK